MNLYYKQPKAKARASQKFEENPKTNPAQIEIKPIFQRRRQKHLASCMECILLLVNQLLFIVMLNPGNKFQETGRADSGWTGFGSTSEQASIDFAWLKVGLKMDVLQAGPGRCSVLLICTGRNIVLGQIIRVKPKAIVQIQICHYL